MPVLPFSFERDHRKQQLNSNNINTQHYVYAANTTRSFSLYFSKLFLFKGFSLLFLTFDWFYISNTVVLEFIALCIDYVDISCSIKTTLLLLLKQFFAFMLFNYVSWNDVSTSIYLENRFRFGSPQQEQIRKSMQVSNTLPRRRVMRHSVNLL